MIKNIKKIILGLFLLLFTIVIFTTINKIVSFDFSTLEDQDSPIIESNDSLNDAQNILKEYGYSLKDVYDDETQPNMPDIKTYNYEGPNGIISIRTSNNYIYEVKYYE